MLLLTALVARGSWSSSGQRSRRTGPELGLIHPKGPVHTSVPKSKRLNTRCCQKCKIRAVSSEKHSIYGFLEGVNLR